MEYLTNAISVLSNVNSAFTQVALGSSAQSAIEVTLIGMGSPNATNASVLVKLAMGILNGVSLV